ncbi:LOW QUALITY PROTEIN: uncharacterized protein LOC112560779 [Pomacea canaliculata]|uniref:LOW QUALITY PROTEIN: uncharacterized protein LOC112560779 n=1 Tax=Pomacea canaliculata TaxID=400727 RepID=UPI000D72A686|nr:LOW QUALITY PROTEIN: uncharacterized protein LOC112560779 [Pomacea canaliculata]
MEDSGRESIVIVLAIVRLCLAVFGCIANTVSAVVLTNRKLWSPTSMLLLSLVVYDALYLLLVLPITAISISINVHYTAAKYSALMTITSLSFSLRFMTQMASTYTTVTVTIERCLVILLPLKARSIWTHGKTRRAIFAVLILTVIFNIPRCFNDVLVNSQTTATTPEGLGLIPNSLVSATGSQPLAVSLNGGHSSQRQNRTLPRKRPQNRKRSHVIPSTLRSDQTNQPLYGTPRSTGVGTSEETHSYLSRPVNMTTINILVGGSWGNDSGDASYEEGQAMRGLKYLYQSVYLSYLTVIFLYLLPYTLILFFNIQLLIALRRRKEETRRISIRNEHRMSGNSCTSPTNREEDLTYIVLGITLCFFVCCILPTVYMISTLATGSSGDMTSTLLLNAGETTLAINAATDFFFYCLLGRKFRYVFMKTFCPKRYLQKTKAITLRSTMSYSSV